MHCDLPTIEIDLQQLLGRALPIGGEQKSRLPVVQFAALAFAIRGGRHDQQPQWAPPRAALPVHCRHLFIANLSPLAPIEQLGLLPRPLLILAHWLWGKLPGVIKAARTLRGTQAQHRILARAGKQLGPVAVGTEASAVAETAVASQHPNLLLSSRFIQLLPQWAHPLDEAWRQVVLLARLLVLLPSFRLGLAGGFLHAGNLLKTDGQPPRADLGQAMHGD